MDLFAFLKKIALAIQLGNSSTSNAYNQSL